MPSQQLVLSASPSTVFPGVPASRVKVSIIANAATVVATGDGSYPTLPSSGTTVPNGIVIPGVLGQQGFVTCPIPGGHMALPQINLASSGNPTVVVSW